MPINAIAATAAIKDPSPHNKLKKHYNNNELRAKLGELKLALMKGDHDDDIREALDVSPQRYNDLKRELYRQENTRMVHKTTEDVYLEYSWAQQQVIGDLRELLAEVPENQPNAKVGALKAISDIHDKVLKTGQDMGVINREPERKMVVHGHVVAKMDNEELRRAIVQETRLLATALDRYGETDMAGNVISGSGPTFTEQAKTGIAMAGPAKAEAARKSRIAVKRTKVIDVDPG